MMITLIGIIVSVPGFVLCMIVFLVAGEMEHRDLRYLSFFGAVMSAIFAITCIIVDIATLS